MMILIIFINNSINHLVFTHKNKILKLTNLILNLKKCTCGFLTLILNRILIKNTRQDSQ